MRIERISGGLPAVVACALAWVLVATGAPAAAGEVQPLPATDAWDYQLGGARPVPARVDVVVRDRRAAPVGGEVYDVCYVNGFQTQPDEKRFWRDRWRLVLKRGGEPVVDGAWGEWLLDLRTPAKRRALARIVGRWTDRCAEDGFAAVEYDNLDSFTRSRGLLTAADAEAHARRLVSRAHDAGLAAAQKNRAQWDGTAVGYDFAIAEQCAQYDECGDYVDTWGDRVLPVEYRRRAFRSGCRDWGDELPVLRRDVALTAHGTRHWCS